MNEEIYLGNVRPVNAEQEEYRQKLRSVVVRGEEWCLVVFGKIGNGKTYMAKVALNTFNRIYGNGVYVTQSILQSELRDIESSRKAFVKYTTCPLLILDELSDRPSDWTEFVKTSVENIIVERHANRLAFVLIGNTDGDRLMAMFDARIRDRLKEGLVMQMKGKSLRKEASYGAGS